MWLECRHPKWHRRLQGANPCAEHGRHHVRSLDQPDCTITAYSDIKQRAFAVMHESQYVDPDWKDEPYHNSSYPLTFTDDYIEPQMSMWKLKEGEDFDNWNTASAEDGDDSYLQRRQPILDYGAPNLLSASWNETGSFMEPTHTGGRVNYSNEWESMSQVRPRDSGLTNKAHALWLPGMHAGPQR